MVSSRFELAVLAVACAGLFAPVHGARGGGPAFEEAAVRRYEVLSEEANPGRAFTASLTERALVLMRGASGSAELLEAGEGGSFANNGLLHENILLLFREWMDFHGKTYDDETVFSRFRAFKDNLKYIHAHEERQGLLAAPAKASYTLGLNALADVSLDEFRANYLGTHPENRGSLPSRAQVTDAELGKKFVPGSLGKNESVNWVERGAVSEVKNQGHCGSCWSFSTTGAVEGANAVLTGKLVSLSEQELVDCDTAMDHGCQGGIMDYAFQFVEDHGLDTEKDYPYQGVQSECDTARENRLVVSIDGFEDIPAGNEHAMIKAVRKHPVSVAIQANHQNFQLYTGGVFDDPECGTQLDHGVLVAGMGTSEDDQDYWLMKNSWGPLWGDEGYMKMAMGVAPAGICGITKMSSYPIKKSVDPPPGPPTPPGPGPSPSPKVQCNQVQQCEANTTCCCMFELQQTCLVYSCCPYAEAVCCDDKKSCCPADTTCNTAAGTCDKPTNASIAAAQSKLARIKLPFL